MNTFADVGLFASIKERDSMWLVVTLSPWPEDDHPEVVFWNGDYWSYERGDGRVYSYREAVEVAASLPVPQWANGLALALNVADMDRDEDAYMATLFTDYRRRLGKVRHAISRQSLDALRKRGRHQERLT